MMARRKRKTERAKEDLQDKVLEFLRSIGGKKVEFGLDEAASRLSTSREELEEALFLLQRRGLLKIVKIPPSSRVIDLLREEIEELDGLFLANEISREEYLKRWEEITGITERSALGMGPLSPIEIEGILKDINDRFNYLERLKDIRAADVKERLLDEYNGEIFMLTERLKRIVNASLSYLELKRTRIEELNRKIELIEADSRVRGVSREREIKECMDEVRSALERIDRVMNFIAGRKEVGEEERRKLLEELRRMEEERDLLKARALVEGRDLSKDVEPIERRIEEIKSRMKEISEAGSLLAIHERLKKLREMGFVREDVYKRLDEFLNALKSAREVSMEWKDLRGKSSIPGGLPKLMSSLQKLESLLL